MFLAHLFLFGFFEGTTAPQIALPTRTGGISSRKFKRPPYWWEPVEEDEPEIPFVAPIVRDPKPVPFHAFPDISLDLEGAELQALISTALRRAQAIPEPRKRVGRALKVMKVQKTLRLMKLLEVYERS